MNGLYNDARYKMQAGTFHWMTDLLLVAWKGTPNFLATDKIVSDVLARNPAGIMATSEPITDASIAADGTGRTNNVLFKTVPIGSVTWFTMCKKQVSTNLSELILFVDQAENLPFTTNGLDVLVTPDWLQNRGWFRP